MQIVVELSKIITVEYKSSPELCTYITYSFYFLQHALHSVPAVSYPIAEPEGILEEVAAPNAPPVAPFQLPPVDGGFRAWAFVSTYPKILSSPLMSTAI